MAGKRATLCLAGVFALLGAGLVGCIFDTRDPEPGGGDVCFESFPSTDEESVFANLDGSLACLQPASYLVQIADDFVFLAAPNSKSQYPGIFPDDTAWGRSQEEAFLDRLFADADSVVSKLLIEETTRLGTVPEVEIEGPYRVRVVTDGRATVYSGVARYTVRQIGTNWRMTKWEELASESPIGLLRGGLSQ